MASTVSLIYAWHELSREHWFASLKPSGSFAKPLRIPLAENDKGHPVRSVEKTSVVGGDTTA